MRHVWKFSARSAWTVALTIVMAGLGLLGINGANSATLDGFSINTQDKAVTVTLYTDQRMPYTTETQGKQFSIILPNAQLSPSQLDDGLPVVIDNKNQFIGRAVPTDDGQVKIILPNLPAEEYAVSIQQKQIQPRKTASAPSKPVVPAQSAPPQTTQKTASAALPAIKPRPAMSVNPDKRLEQVAARLQQKRTAANNAQQEPTLRLSPARPQRNAGHTIWNPYVVKTTPAPERTASTSPAEPVSTVSVAEPPPRNTQPAYSTNYQAASAPPADPLWYLHSIPPAAPIQPGTLLPPADDMQGLAKAATAPVNEVAPTVASAPTTPPVRPLHLLKEAFMSLPKWLLITVGLFFGGLGLFGLIGGLVLLKVLFTQVQSSLQPAFVWANPPLTVPQPVSTGPAPPPRVQSPPKATPKATPITQTRNKPSVSQRPSRPVQTRYASQPTVPTGMPRSSAPLFEDTSSINAMDYMKRSAKSVSEAVHNAALLKSPHARTRVGTRR